MYTKPTYKEITSVKVTGNRELVISESSNGGFTLGQRVKSIDSMTGETIALFMKGAIPVRDIETLVAVRDAVNFVIDGINPPNKKPTARRKS